MALSAGNQLRGIVEETKPGDIMAHVVVKVGDKLTFAVSIEDMKFFDEATGLAIRG